MILKLRVPELNKHTAEKFESLLDGVKGVRSVDTWRGRAEVKLDEGAQDDVMRTLAKNGFAAEIGELEAPAEVTYRVTGMTCRSCEINIERKLGKVPGVRKASANVAKSEVRLVCDISCAPTVQRLNEALAGHDYRITDGSGDDPVFAKERPSALRLVALVAAVLVLGSVFSNLQFLSGMMEVSENTGFFAAVVIGLVAGASSCIAVSGGLLLSSVAQYRAKYGGGSFGRRLAPALYFVGGRTVSYAVLGGMIGVLGAALSPSPFVTGMITLVAAAFMLVMGLDMLGYAPAWAKGLLPRMPKSIAHRVADKENSQHPFAPAALGAATFFLPCGFTQSLQLYALTTGSFVSGALLLGGFALGTVPALLALSYASTSLKGRVGRLFFQFAGVAVIMLGLWNAQNGLTAAGYPVSFLWSNRPAVADANLSAPTPKVTDNLQVITMTVGGTGGAYVPSVLTVKVGIPVRWEVTGENVGGCLSGLISPKLGISTLLKRGMNVIEFTPEKPGSYTFSCAMGMFYGTINVI